LDSYDSVVVVEGRADVITLLRNGIKNVIAIEGTSVPKVIADLSKQKTVTAFLDGDRGGDLILKELLSVAELDFVARAPRGKEVEELGKKEIFQCLRAKEPTGQTKPEIIKEEQVTQPTPTYKTGIEFNKLERFREILEDLTGTRAACFLDGSLEILGRVPIKEMFSAMRELDAEVILLDGDVDQKLVNQCASNGIKYVIGMKVGRIRTPEGLFVLTIQDLK
jgi:DNA primase